MGRMPSARGDRLEGLVLSGRLLLVVQGAFDGPAYVGVDFVGAGDVVPGAVGCGGAGVEPDAAQADGPFVRSRGHTGIDQFDQRAVEDRCPKDTPYAHIMVKIAADE